MKNKIVKDIITKNAQVIFIMESPHDTELKTGIPLSGSSGKVFSKELFNDSETCAGPKIIKENIKYSIVNTFQFALQRCNLLKELNKKLKKDLTINEIRDIYVGSDVARELSADYKRRVINTINNADKNVRIVVCGKKAQAYFEYVFENMWVNFGNITKRMIDKREYLILYVSHPSLRNSLSPWSVDDFRNRQFKEFVELKNC